MCGLDSADDEIMFLGDVGINRRVYISQNPERHILTALMTSIKPCMDSAGLGFGTVIVCF
jgi:hypothetical protein